MSKLHLRQTNESVSSSPPKSINHGDTTSIPVLDHQTCPHRGQRAFEKPTMRSAAQASRRNPSPKYQREDESMSSAIPAAIPTKGTDPHFMNVAARNAFRIFACSVRSGRMGRMLCRTFQISDPAPLTFDCKPERHRRVHCIWLVGRQNHARLSLLQKINAPIKRPQITLFAANKT